MKNIFYSLCLIFIFMTSVVTIVYGETLSYNNTLEDSIKYRTVTVKAGTRLTLETVETINSEEVEKGDIIQLRVVLDINQDLRTTVFSTDQYAEARVTKVKKRRVFGKGGYVEIVPESVRTVDGKLIEVRGDTKSATGKHNEVFAWGLSVLAPTSGLLVGTPITIIFIGSGFFVKGGEAIIKPGEKLSAYVKEDFILYP